MSALADPLNRCLAFRRSGIALVFGKLRDDRCDDNASFPSEYHCSKYLSMRFERPNDVISPSLTLIELAVECWFVLLMPLRVLSSDHLTAND